MPKQCVKCNGPGTAGPNPHLDTVNICVKCAAIERVQIPQSGERLDRLPASITNGLAWGLVQPFATGDAIWLHQARALTELDQGNNVVVATSTASGKTIVFQAWAIEVLNRNPEATALVFYPTKALANDQHRRWQAACEKVGIPTEHVGQIDGEIRMADRARIMAKARVVIMTPDVCHAWMLRTAREEHNDRFLRNLTIVIMDEAHIYESVLGSNAAFFFRRLSTAVVNAGKQTPPQYIAATATIQEPKQHLEMLTGQSFVEIGEDLNGAPRYSRELLHIAYNPRGGAGENQVADLVMNIIENDPNAQVIAFYDNRQGIERIVHRIGKPRQVLPYRSGYLAEDRRKIEDSLRANTIRAVISTSALELGIDMPDLNFGINLDLPVTRKQFHQRLGRVGRSQPGVFIIMAPSNRFRDYGETLREYYDNSVEPSQMYLENEYVNFRQARCLKDELRRAGKDTRVPPGCVQWPPGFDAALQSTHGRAAPYLQKMEEATLNSPPQMAYSLRTAGDESLSIIVGKPDEDEKTIGNINVREAMREAYPGAVYRHHGKPYRVESWGRNQQTRKPQMRVAHITGKPGHTEPIGRKIVIIPQGSNNVISRRNLHRGYVAESRVVILDSVEGFSGDNGQLEGMIFYREQAKQDSRMSRKQREIPTTGVHIRIQDEWFQGDRGDPWQARHQIARAMRSHLTYQRSIAMPDVGYQVDNVVMETPRGFLDLDDSIIVHDNIHGGMGLTHDLYANLEKYIRKLSAGTDEEEGGVYHQYIEEMSQWSHEDDGENTQGDLGEEPGEGNWWMVVRPGSEVVVNSEKQQRMVLAEVTGCVWRSGIRYEVTTQDGEVLEFRDGNMKPRQGGLDFQYWKPETGAYIEMSTAE